MKNRKKAWTKGSGTRALARQFGFPDLDDDLDESSNEAPVRNPRASNRAPTPPMPHDADPRVHFIEPPETPSVVFTRKAVNQIGAYVGFTSSEIGWMSYVDADADGNLRITECVLLEQDANAGTNEIHANALAKLTHEILETDPENGAERIASLKCWGHSHHTMPTNPSKQDDQQMDDFASGVSSRMIRVIANKQNHMRVDVWDYANNLIFTDVPWSVEDDVDDEAEAIRKEIGRKVHTLKPVNRSRFHRSTSSESVPGRNSPFPPIPGFSSSINQEDDIQAIDDTDAGYSDPDTHMYAYHFQCASLALNVDESSLSEHVIDGLENPERIDELLRLLGEDNTFTGTVDSIIQYRPIDDDDFDAAPFEIDIEGARCVFVLDVESEFVPPYDFKYDPRTQCFFTRDGSIMTDEFGDSINVENVVAVFTRTS